jgi:DNA-binding transcriptional MerR regulator
MDGRFPEKLFYRIGDVSEITGVKPHVLRYWESEFSGLHPRKNQAGQRIYERRDVELALEIKKLLYEQGYTIPGARQLLSRQARHAEKHARQPRTTGELSQALKICREELQGLLLLLQHQAREVVRSPGKSPGTAEVRKRRAETGE